MSTLTIQIQRGKKTNFVMTGKNNIKNTFLLLQVFNYQTSSSCSLFTHLYRSFAAGLCCLYSDWCHITFQISSGWITHLVPQKWGEKPRLRAKFSLWLGGFYLLHPPSPQITTLACNGGLHPRYFIFMQRTKWQLVIHLEFVSRKCTF